MTTLRFDGPSSQPDQPGRGPARKRTPLELSEETLAAIASLLGVTLDEVQTLPADQLRKWANHPDTLAEMDARQAAASPAGPAPEAANLPPEMMAAIADAIGVSVEELRGATHDELLAWLADPNHFFATRAARAAVVEADTPPAAAGGPDVAASAAAPPAPPAAADVPARTEGGLAPGNAEAAAGASSLQRFRDLRRQTLRSRLNDRPELLNWLQTRIDELERAEDAARANVRPVPPPAARPAPRPQPDNSSPDLMLIKSARALKSTPPPPPPPSLFSKIASGLGSFFKRSDDKKNKNSRPPRR